MRLPKTEYTERPWRLQDIAPDFTIEDVWSMPTPGGPDDLPELVRQMTTRDEKEQSSWIYRALFAIRWKLGAVFGLDKPDSGVGARVPTLRDRLPEDLRDAPSGPKFDGYPLTPVFMTGNEFVAEMANKTVHGVMHIGWVRDKTGGGYSAQMTVLVKPNGFLGKLYMAAIVPFRYTFVYPSLMRTIGRAWERRTGGRTASAGGAANAGGTANAGGAA